jgi:hypothetical protein
VGAADVPEAGLLGSMTCFAVVCYNFVPYGNHCNFDIGDKPDAKIAKMAIFDIGSRRSWAQNLNSNR